MAMLSERLPPGRYTLVSDGGGHILLMSMRDEPDGSRTELGWAQLLVGATICVCDNGPFWFRLSACGDTPPVFDPPFWGEVAAQTPDADT